MQGLGVERLDGKIGCEFTVSKVSDKEGRDFEGALKVITQLLDQRIGDNLPEDREMQVFVVIITVAFEDRPSRTFESTPSWIKGRRKLAEPGPKWTKTM